MDSRELIVLERLDAAVRAPGPRSVLAGGGLLARLEADPSPIMAWEPVPIDLSLLMSAWKTSTL